MRLINCKLDFSTSYKVAQQITRYLEVGNRNPAVNDANRFGARVSWQKAYRKLRFQRGLTS